VAGFGLTIRLRFDLKGNVKIMTDDKSEDRPKQPAEAHREGLEQLDHRPHHPTTAKSHPARYEEGPEIVAEPEVEHRGGRLPNQKK